MAVVSSMDRAVLSPRISATATGNVLDAMKREMERNVCLPTTFENEPTEDLARDLAGRMPGDLDRIFFVASGSEAVESVIMLARQWAIATGQPRRWKVIAASRPIGGTLGALAVTGDPALTGYFAEQMRSMPTIPSPTAYRDRDDLTMKERGIKYADMLKEQILAEGPQTVVAFIIERIGGAATNTLVAPDSYYTRIREICDQYGILLIHDEVLSGVARTDRFLGGDHWNCRPNMIACLTENAAAHGEDLLRGLRGLQARFPLIGDFAVKG